MAKWWLAVLALTFGASAQAKGIQTSIRCEFMNTKNERIVVKLQLDVNGGDLVIGTPSAIDEVEPKPAFGDLRGGTLDVFVIVKQKVAGTKRMLPHEEDRAVRAFQLQWIPGKDSKKWKLISADPVISGLSSPPICVE